MKIAKIAIPLFVLAAAVGCSPSVIVDHARAAQVVGPVVSAAGEVIDAARDLELDACDTAPDPEACLDAGEERWAPGVAAYNLVVSGWDGWVEGLSIAASAQLGNVDAMAYLLPLLRVLVNAWTGLTTALEPFENLDLPDFPGLGVLGGASR